LFPPRMATTATPMWGKKERWGEGGKRKKGRKKIKGERSLLSSSLLHLRRNNLLHPRHAVFMPGGWRRKEKGGGKKKKGERVPIPRHPGAFKFPSRYTRKEKNRGGGDRKEKKERKKKETFYHHLHLDQRSAGAPSEPLHFRPGRLVKKGEREKKKREKKERKSGIRQPHVGPELLPSLGRPRGRTPKPSPNEGVKEKEGKKGKKKKKRKAHFLPL